MTCNICGHSTCIGGHSITNANADTSEEKMMNLIRSHCIEKLNALLCLSDTAAGRMTNDTAQSMQALALAIIATRTSKVYGKSG